MSSEQHALIELLIDLLLNAPKNYKYKMQGMIEFRNALSDIVEEFGTDDGGFQVRQRAAFIRL